MSCGAEGGGDGPLLVTVAPLEWRSGLEHALVAVAAALAAGVRFRYRVSGSGDLEDQARFTAADLGLGEVLELTPPRGLALAGASGYLHTSLVDQPGTGLAAARAAGLPVVRTVAGPPPAPGELVVAPWDPPALAAAVVAWARRASHPGESAQVPGPATSLGSRAGLQGGPRP
jgi:glycosyltransferase involved in cell wall biosynthesis